MVSPRQGSLLETVTPAGIGKHHRAGPDTEKLAARAIAPRTGSQRHTVLLHLVLAGWQGLTDGQLEEVTGLRRSSICARRNELREHGYVADSGRRRRDPSGMQAIIWKASAKGCEYIVGVAS